MVKYMMLYELRLYHIVICYILCYISWAYIRLC